LLHFDSVFYCFVSLAIECASICYIWSWIGTRRQFQRLETKHVPASVLRKNESMTCLSRESNINKLKLEINIEFVVLKLAVVRINYKCLCLRVWTKLHVLTSRAMLGSISKSSSRRPSDISGWKTNGWLGRLESVPFSLKVTFSCDKSSLKRNWTSQVGALENEKLPNFTHLYV
jgi:hypothetical protein